MPIGVDFPGVILSTDQKAAIPNLRKALTGLT